MVWLMVYPLIIWPASISAQGAAVCGDLKNAYGPFDYTNPKHFSEKLQIVETAHFTFKVEALRVGGETGSLVKDLGYTLRAFPNHHRALYAMSRYQLQKKGKGGARYSMECYFDRAMRMNSTDGKVRLLFGLHLHKLKMFEDALAYYKEALLLVPESDSADLHYNMGLLYTDLGQYDEALEHARIAYARNHPLPGLQNRLQKRGLDINSPPAPDNNE